MKSLVGSGANVSSKDNDGVTIIMTLCTYTDGVNVVSVARLSFFLQASEKASYSTFMYT